MGTLRIIAGKWRGRKIPVLDVAGLRPTPNMVRETLFNWLMSVIDGAVCLDLFAGSGALSFEALSRGAQQVVAVDCSQQVVRQLQQNARLLLGEEASDAVAVTTERSNAGNNAGLIILHARMPQQIFLIPPRKFNVIFLDPPFHHGFIEQTIIKLEQFSRLILKAQAEACDHDKAQVKVCEHNNSWLADDALIYIEAEKELDVASLLPLNWKMLRSKTLGAVGYYLIERQVSSV